MIRNHWRSILAGLPLPMLALAASYGVYSFALLFVPWPVALVQAAAFELVYIGLAVLIGLDGAQRRRASYVSVGAVVVSILYNSLAGLFHRRPELLASMPLAGDVALAVLHGLPLALVAYAVADLLLHREPQNVVDVERRFSASTNIIPVRPAARDYTCKHCGEKGLTNAEIMTHGRVRKATGACPEPQSVAAAD